MKIWRQSDNTQVPVSMVLGNCIDAPSLKQEGVQTFADLTFADQTFADPTFADSTFADRVLWTEFFGLTFADQTFADPTFADPSVYKNPPLFFNFDNLFHSVGLFHY